MTQATPVEDFRARVQQAQLLAQLAGPVHLQAYRDYWLLLERFGMDKPGDGLLLDGADWMWLLLDRPELAQKMPDWTLLNSYQLSTVLMAHPHLAVYVTDWHVLRGYSWVRLLQRQPQFVNHMDNPDRLSEVHWRLLLAKQPQLAKHKTQKGAA